MYPSRRVFMLFGDADGAPPIGTGFNIDRRGLVLTAAHVVKGLEHVWILNTSLRAEDRRLLFPCSNIIRHPSADVAALVMPEDHWADAEHFSTRNPDTGYRDFPLGTDVASYGYPMIGGEKPVPPRLMKGHIQRAFVHREEGYRYAALELGFPAFAGQSGSPVFLDDVLYLEGRTNAIGIVTRWVTYETEEGGEKSSVRWAVGASLTPLQEWLRRL